MAWQRRGLVVMAVTSWLMSGCAQLPDYALPPRSLALDISPPLPPQTRAQMGDAPQPVQIQAPAPLDIPSPIRPNLGGTPLVAGTQQVSYASHGSVKVRVAAWVNGQPIFDNEVMQMANGDPSRVAKAIEDLMDQEVIFQDAVKRIKKSPNPHALDKLKEFVDLEFDKSVERMRNAKPPVPEQLIKDMEPAARRLLERNLVSTEYVRSRIKGIVEALIGLVQIREYYEDHKNEFKSVDKVVWQDIYIPLNPNQPTIDVLKRFGEDLANKCLTPDDFNKLIIYDGLGKNGEGHGNLRGQIRPAELEPILFALEPGKIGPVVPLGSGIHLIRVTKREFDGQLPLNEEVAKTIRKKLEKEVADREYRHIVRELRARAVCRVEMDGR
jgi:parvulin-like peptidyl-prolyl isomerase